MTTLSVQPRTKQENTTSLRKEGKIPAVLYGSKRSSVSCSIERKAFESALKEAGESTLVTLEFNQERPSVFIAEIQRDPLTGGPIHVDFFEPSLTEETEVDVPLSFVGEAGAVKDLGGTLVKNIQEIEVRGLPQNLPHEIFVDISVLASFNDKILVKDLPVTGPYAFLKDSDEIVAQVLPAENVEQELAKSVNEDVENVQKIEKEKKAADDEESKE